MVAKHEITHRMQEMAPEAYRKYRDYAMSALTERDGSTASIVEQYKSRYAEAGVNLSTEQAMDEIAADFTEALTVDPARFETLAKENRSVARKLLDAVRDFIRKAYHKKPIATTVRKSTIKQAIRKIFLVRCPIS